MASVAPPQPTYRPRLPQRVISNGILSAPQLETVIYAGSAHQNFLPAHYQVDETLDNLKRVPPETEGAVQFRRGYFIGDSTGNPLQLKINKQQQQRPIFLYTVKLYTMTNFYLYGV
jgi:hypothetical protein